MESSADSLALPCGVNLALKFQFAVSRCHLLSVCLCNLFRAQNSQCLLPSPSHIVINIIVSPWSAFQSLSIEKTTNVHENRRYGVCILCGDSTRTSPGKAQRRENVGLYQKTFEHLSSLLMMMIKHLHEMELQKNHNKILCHQRFHNHHTEKRNDGLYATGFY